MANKHGDFIWYELMTADPAGARVFYEAVVGWTTSSKSAVLSSGAEYREIIGQDGNHTGGILQLTPPMADAGTRPAWFGYIAVDKVDAVVAKALELGANVFLEPTNMEGIGRLALLADPQGVPFYVMRGFPDEVSKAFQMMSPGHVAWNELNTADAAAARTFYYDLFGWTDGEAMPMGELGTYQMFDQNGQTVGAMMGLVDKSQTALWQFYFAVDDIDRAHEAIGAHGGTVLQAPQEIPGGMYSVNAADPQGATFAIVGPRNRAREV